MRVIYPNYKKSLVNFSCSILKNFGIKENKSTLRIVDQLLKEEDYQNIIVLLYDGMGSKLLDSVLPKSGFLLQHKVMDITSVIPSTTMSATTSVLSAKTPYEHGWLGWNMYFKDYDQTVSIARNTIKNTDTPVDSVLLKEEKLGYESIIDRINRDTEHKAYGIFPFGMGAYNKKKEAYDRIVNLSQHDGKKFIYAYFIEPDYMMHERGVGDRRVEDELFDIQDEIEALSERVENSLILVIADHGMIDCKPIILKDYPDIFSLLERTVSIESRCCSFKIKDGYYEEFRNLFSSYFGEKFLLYSKEDVIEKQLFGIGEENAYFQDGIGDFLAIATDNQYFLYDENDNVFTATHAGLTRDEMIVPIIAVKKKVCREIVRKVEMKDFDVIKEMANCLQKGRVLKRKDVFQKSDVFLNVDFVTLCNRSTPNTCFVYEIGEVVIGFVEVSLVVTGREKIYTERAYIKIEKIYIKEEYRRKGYATKLYQQVLKYAKKNHIKKVEISIWDFDDDAIEFVYSLKPKLLNQTFEIFL